MGCSRESRLNFTEIFTINRLRHRCGAVEGRAFSGTVVAVLEIPAWVVVVQMCEVSLLCNEMLSWRYLELRLIKL